MKFILRKSPGMYIIKILYKKKERERKNKIDEYIYIFSLLLKKMYNFKKFVFFSLSFFFSLKYLLYTSIWIFHFSLNPRSLYTKSIAWVLCKNLTKILKIRLFLKDKCLNKYIFINAFKKKK